MEKVIKTLKEVLDEILRGMPLPDRNAFKKTKEEDLIMHHFNFGMQIRNTFGLWTGNPELLEDMELPSKTHPDEVSQKIIEALWKRLNDDNL